MAGATWLVAVLALLVHVSSANEASPMTKVVELLQDIHEQLEQDADKEAKLYNEYKKWCDNEVAQDRQTIKATKEQIATLKSDLENEESFREQKNGDIEDIGNEVAKNSADLQEAKDRRQTARNAFLEEERSLVQAIDQLERALVVMAKKAPGAAALPQTAGLTQTSSLADVAETLRQTMKSPDFQINEGQKSTLEDFFRTVVQSQGMKGESPALDFLQVGANVKEDGPRSAGVTNTLRGILENTKKDKNDQMKAEMEAQHSFELFAMPLQREIADGQKALAEMKNQVSKSQQVSAEKTAEKAQAEELLAQTEKHLADTLASCHQKALDYQARVAKRSDEIMAIKMALQIMTSSAAKKLSGKQSVGSDLQLSFLQTRSDRSTTHVALLSFLQTRSTTRRALAHLRASRFADLTVLSTQAQSLLSSGGRADPFVKVKKMIQEMIVKLLDEAAEEAEHKEWCDKEMAKSTESKTKKEKEVVKLTTRIDTLEAQLAELKTEVDTLSRDMADMQTAVSQATKIRGKEKRAALSSIKEYQDAQVLLNNALTVLKEFYDKQDKFTLVQTDTQSNATQPDTGNIDQGSGGYKAQGASQGVMGLLEIAIEDFANLESETTTQEATAAHEYDTFMKDSEVQQAVWKKDFEYKNTLQVRLKGELQRAKGDLEGTQKELAAVVDYIEKLEPSCNNQGDSYEERKERREKEIKSLQEALAIMNGDAIA